MKDMVFKQRNGKTYISVRPRGGLEATPAQIAHRERFGQAVAYSKFALADPGTRAVYDAAEEQKDIPAFALAIGDFLNVPTIGTVDVSTYTGLVGSKIGIVTHDDIGVVTVDVNLTDDGGTVLESGQAVEQPAGTGHWTYTAQSAAPSETTVQVRVTAKDRPGGTAVQTATKAI